MEDLPMEIILIRHGKAEERSSGRADEGRCLTAEGRRRLEKSLAGYRRFLDRHNQILIWSSPLLRAMQTADIIAGALQIESVCPCDCLSNGDFSAFLAALAAVGKDTTLILVGHEPYLSEWSQQLCGLVLPFKKGAAAGFSLTALVPPSGELLWFAQPNILMRTAGHQESIELPPAGTEP
jgi:phosphohistidine phosphatase